MRPEFQYNLFQQLVQLSFYKSPLNNLFRSGKEIKLCWSCCWQVRSAKIRAHKVMLSCWSPLFSIRSWWHRTAQARMVLRVTLWQIFRKISKLQNIKNCMPRTDTYDKLISKNAFSHLPLSNVVIFFISLLIKRHNVTFWGT